MIIDLRRFIDAERRYWNELDTILGRIEDEPKYGMSLDQVKRLQYLYHRTSADLARIMTFSSEPETRRFLESLTARAYGYIHETRERPHRFRPIFWFMTVFPRTFRSHIRAFYLSLAITLVGCAFGGLAVGLDPASKQVLLPFSHLQGSPGERVAREEAETEDRLSGRKFSGAAWYMTHNTKVSIFVMATGITWGIGTVILLFYNGVILGAVTVDYMFAKQTEFLAGWLMPHGVIEIPAVLIAGQAGLVLAGALIGWGKRVSLNMRLRTVSHDLVTLIGGVGLLLVWAGFIESSISQYHWPVLPYSFKIGLGAVELVLLFLFLARSGTRKGPVNE